MPANPTHPLQNTSMAAAFAAALKADEQGQNQAEAEAISNIGDIPDLPLPEVDGNAFIDESIDMNTEPGILDAIDDTAPGLLPPGSEPDLLLDPASEPVQDPAPVETVSLDVVADAFVSVNPDTLVETRVVFRVPVISGADLVMPEGLKTRFLPHNNKQRERSLDTDTYSGTGIGAFLLNALNRNLSLASAPVSVLPQHVEDTLTFLTQRYVSGAQHAVANLVKVIANAANTHASDVEAYLDSAMAIDVEVADGPDVNLWAESDALDLALTTQRKIITVVVSFRQALCHNFEVPRNAEDDYQIKYVAQRLRNLAQRLSLVKATDPTVEFLLDADIAVRDACDFSVMPSIQGMLAEGINQETIRGIDNPFVDVTFVGGCSPRLQTTFLTQPATAG